MLKIHGSPQKTAYTDQSEWPFLSAQGHWGVPEQAGMVSHTHLEATVPIYAELDGASQLAIPIQFQLFHVAGMLSQVWSDHGAFVLDPPGHWQEYANVPGDPNGVVLVKGTFYLDLHQSDGKPTQVPKHGWFGVQLNGRTIFANGDRTDVYLTVPFFSVIDPGQPEVPSVGDGMGPTIRSACVPLSPRDSILNVWGVLRTEFREVLPILAPFDTPWNPRFLAYSYANTGTLPISVTEIRKDMDLHHGNPGVLLPLQPTFDPGAIGTGTHKLGFIWGQASGPDGAPGVGPHETAAALLVVNVNIGEGATIPPVDPPPIDPPPVDPPPVDPPPVDPPPDHEHEHGPVVPVEFRRLGDVVTLCCDDGKCLVLGTVID